MSSSICKIKMFETRTFFWFSNLALKILVPWFKFQNL